MKARAGHFFLKFNSQRRIFRNAFLITATHITVAAGIVRPASAGGIRAFPGAEGAGAYSAGGRGGDVYHVTNLADDDASGTAVPGSLRYGIKYATGPRTIVFDISGMIELTGSLKLDQNNITIAGQTAPGGGIGVKNYPIVPEANDLIMRFFRLRTGYGSYNGNNATDCLSIESGTNMIFDHLSVQFGGDESISATHQPWNLTVQWCLLSDSLNFQNHGYGSLIAPELSGTRISWHHNLYSNNDGRNARMGSRLFATNFVCDYVNNIMYNWGSKGDWGCWGVVGGNPNEETLDVNFINNYAIAGKSTTGTMNYGTGIGSRNKNTVAFSSNFATTRIWQSGNLIDSDKDTNRNGVNTGWTMFGGTYIQMSAPFPIDPTNAINAEETTTGYLNVLRKAGASQVRDSADLRAINYVRNNTGTNINLPTDVVGYTNTDANGFAILSTFASAKDTDGDGMPDYWENAVGLNPLVADNNLDRNGDGYTELEDYLNWLAGPHAVGNINAPLNVDLRTVNGSSSNTISFTVGNATNGTVTLLPDGFTAQLVPATNFMGLASFDFIATDIGTGTNLGTSTLVAVITTSNTPPAVSVPGPTTVVAGSTLSTSFGATDNDQPPQSFTFSILNLPAGATLNPATGKLIWRPAIAQAGTNILTVVVADSGSPSLTATNYYTAVVTLPKQPSIQSIKITNKQVNLTVTGSYNPDYYIDRSTNVSDPTGWVTVFGTNQPIPPVHWTDTNMVTSGARFYRVRLGP